MCRILNHDRADQWVENEVKGPFCSAYYCNENARMQIESELRASFKPSCGDK